MALLGPFDGYSPGWWRIAVTTLPVFPGVGMLASGSAVVSAFTASYTPLVGQQVTGTGVPAGATVATVGVGTFTMSANATASGSTALTIGAEPVSLAEAKAWAVVSFPDDDLIFTDLIQAAREEMEGPGLKRALLLQARTIYFMGFPGGGGFAHQAGVYNPFWLASSQGTIVLPYPPLRAIQSIKYVDQTGTLITIDPTQYRVSADATPGRVQPLFGQFWPISIPEIDSVQIAYTCGYGAFAANIPASTRIAMRQIIEEGFANRGITRTGKVGPNEAWERFRQVENHGSYM